MCPSLSTMKTSHKRNRIFSNTAFQHPKRFCLADASRLCDKLSPWWRVWPPGADRTRTEQTYDVFVHKQAASSSIVSVTRLVWHFVWHWRRESLAPVTTWQWQVWLGIGFKSCVFICFLFQFQLYSIVLSWNVCRTLTVLWLQLWLLQTFDLTWSVCEPLL